MFLTTHAAAGILIGHYTNDPLAVFGISFASHFVLDFIPHGDEELYHDQEWKNERRYRRVILINTVDIAVLTGMIIWVLAHPEYPHGKLMLIGILGSILPDLFSHFFPVIHQRFNWLFILRWMYGLTKPTGLRYIVRLQDWLHDVLHHQIIPKDMPLAAGIVMQAALVAFFLFLAR